MHDRPPATLKKALDFNLSEVLSYDLAAGAVGGGLWGLTSALEPTAMPGVRFAVIPLLGAIIGVVVAAAAIQAAFLDRDFLLRLRLINREPVRYLAPALFTAFIGVLAVLAVLLAILTAPLLPTSLVVAVDVVAGMLSVWTLVSLIPVLSMIVAFLSLRWEAAHVEDDVVIAHRRREDLQGQEERRANGD